MRCSPLLTIGVLLLAVATGCGDPGGSDGGDGGSGGDSRRDRRTSETGSPDVGPDPGPGPGPAPAPGEPPPLDWSPDRTGGPDPQPCGANVRCVGGTGEFATIGAAIDAARRGDTVQVASGTYPEHVVVEGKGLILLGGFSDDFGARDPAATPTVIDGGGDGRTVVVRGATGSVVDGFTITGGAAPLDEYGEAVGSGIRVDTSGDVIISNNLVEGNDDGFDWSTCDCNTEGGGLFVDSWRKGASVVVVGNVFRANSAHRGAAIFANVPAVVEGNLVEANVGRGDHGGGLFLGGDGTVLRQNLVRGNEIGSQAGYGWGGGGIFVGSDAQERPAIVLEANRWVDNFAPGRGSGFFIDEAATGTLTGDLFHDNRCGENGAGFYIDGGAEHGSEAVLTHVTITRNRCARGVNGSGYFAEGGSRIDLVDSIVVGNGGAADLWQCQDCQTPAPAPPTTVTTSLVGPTFGEVETGTGVLDGTPVFVDADGGDFRLAQDSPGRGAAGDGTDLGSYGG